MAPKKRRAPYVSVPPHEIARRASLETHVSNSAAAKLLQPKVKGKGVGKGFSLRQARRRRGEMVKQLSRQITPHGTVVNQLVVDTESGPAQLDYICPHARLHFCMPPASYICTLA